MFSLWTYVLLVGLLRLAEVVVLVMILFALKKMQHAGMAIPAYRLIRNGILLVLCSVGGIMAWTFIFRTIIVFILGANIGRSFIADMIVSLAFSTMRLVGILLILAWVRCLYRRWKDPRLSPAGNDTEHLTHENGDATPQDTQPTLATE